MLSLVLATGLLSTGCNREQQITAETAVVRTDTITADQGRSMVRYPGKVKAGAEANVAFRVSGTIASITVDVGEFVRQGQIIAILDDRDYKTQLEATQAEFNRISADANRVIELFRRGSASASENDKATYGLQQITAKLEAHQNALADTRLKAPFDGYIQKKMFKPGEIIGAGMQVISMLGTQQPELEINITAADYLRMDNALSFTAFIDAMPGDELPLKVIGVTRKANLNQLYTLRLKFSNQKLNSLLTPGMAAEVMIKFPVQANNRLSVPISAVARNNGESFVWLFNNNKVSRRTVDVSEITGDGRAIIASGIKEDDIVVTAGIKSLKEGMQVRQLQPVSVTNAGNLK